MFGVAGIFASIVTLMAKWLDKKVATLVALILIFFLAGWVASDIMQSIMVGVVVTVSLTVVFSMFSFGEIILGKIIKESLKTGKPSRLARIAFLLLVAAYLFLISYSFLGSRLLLS